MNMDNTTHRYALESPAQGRYEARDNKTGVLVTFDEGKFDETQQWYYPVDAAFSQETLNRIYDGLENWLRRFHMDKMVPGGKYTLSKEGNLTVLSYSEDGSPAIRISFPSGYPKNKIVARIRFMAKYLKDNVDERDMNF